MPSLEALRIKIFMEGSDLAAIRSAASDALIHGFTTSPSLLRLARVSNYGAFAQEAAAAAQGKPISIEIFSNDLEAMEREARIVSTWGTNIHVGIPITNAQGQNTLEVIRRLSNDDIPINVTAILTLDQVRIATAGLAQTGPAMISVFAGHLADTGRDPVPFMAAAREILAYKPRAQLLWASCRELFNVFQAEAAGTHAIALPPAILDKRHLVGTDLVAFSLETVRDLARDAQAAGYSIAH